MKFMAQLYDLLFAPASTFDSDAGSASASGTNDFSSSDDFMVNPATGLPMTGGIGGFDMMGNSFGFDLNHHDESASMSDHWESVSMVDTGSMFD